LTKIDHINSKNYTYKWHIQKEDNHLQNKGKEESHDHAKMPTMAICPNCGAWHIYHTVCGECGYYRGKLAIEKKVTA